MKQKLHDKNGDVHVNGNDIDERRGMIYNWGAKMERGVGDNGRIGGYKCSRVQG